MEGGGLNCPLQRPTPASILDDVSVRDMSRRRPTLVPLLLPALATLACGGQTDSSDQGAGGGATTGSNGTGHGTGGFGGSAPESRCGDQPGAPSVTIDAGEERERL